jgi:glutamate/tyrosine decarboxylase-like PLP-dependent enzyme
VTDWHSLLSSTADTAADYLDGVRDRPVAQPVAMADLVAALGGPLPGGPTPAGDVVRHLVRAADPGLVVTNGGRYFGFVEGGVLPASLAADWLASTWDQNPGFAALSPAAAAAEEVCRGWLVDLLGLPSHCSAGFTTGAQLANLTGLAAGLRHGYTRLGWDLDEDGLVGAPPPTVVVGAERHATVDRALRFLGIGRRHLRVVPSDDHGRMVVSELESALTGEGPLLVVAQAGNVNTGGFDPLRAVCGTAHAQDAWVHVDGAFGLWAAASPGRRHLTDGVELADSWATDGHKWLNVPYDCGIVLCAHPDTHRAAMTMSASYLARTGARDGTDWTPESSRRARAFALWAGLRSLGRDGVAELVERCCRHASSLATALVAEPGVEVLNEVVLNQVLVRVGDEERTRAVATAIQAEGRVWLGTTVRHGVPALRVSVSDHATTEADVDVAVDAILAAVRRP